MTRSFSKIKDKISDVFHQSSSNNNKNDESIKPPQNQQQHRDSNKDLDIQYHKHDSRKKVDAAGASPPLSLEENQETPNNRLEKSIPLGDKQITINRNR